MSNLIEKFEEISLNEMIEAIKKSLVKNGFRPKTKAIEKDFTVFEKIGENF